MVTGHNVIVEYLVEDINQTKSVLGIHLYKVPGNEKFHPEDHFEVTGKNNSAD